MGDNQSPWTEIDRRLEGSPLEVGGRTVQPVARLKGWQFSAGKQQGGFSALLAHMLAVEVVVREDAEERTIHLTGPQFEEMRGILMAGATLAVGCLAVMVVAHRLTRKAMKRHKEEVK